MLAHLRLPILIMLLIQAASAEDNPWRDRVPEAVARAQDEPSRLTLRKGFDVTWRADDWVAGLKLAELAQRELPDDEQLYGDVARALWRAGQILAAEDVLKRIPERTRDPVALRTIAGAQLARGEIDAAGKTAKKLKLLRKPTAEDLYVIFTVQLAANEFAGAADLLRRAEELTDAENGYPENFVEEAIDGVAEFLDAIGTEPLNRIAAHGRADMPALVLLNLPACDVMINGHGPYRLIVDTGGSIMVALDQVVADEIGLKSVATASVRGVSGTTESGQALIDDLQIGSIRCKRVVSRIFDVRGAIMNAADGIVGTGIFSEGRMTLDWANAQLVVSPSKTEPGPGTAVDVRLVGDAKLLSPVTIEGQPAVALLDSGADAVALAPSRLKTLFPDEPMQEFSTGIGIGVGTGEMPKITLGSGVRLEFGGRTFENYSGLGLDVLDNTLGPVLGVQCDILLGMPTFREMRSITVDFPRCEMWVDWLNRE